MLKEYRVHYALKSTPPVSHPSPPLSGSWAGAGPWGSWSGNAPWPGSARPWSTWSSAWCKPMNGWDIAIAAVLGLGVSAPMPSLGSLASEARAGVFSYPYRMIIPAVIICIIVLSLNLIGDGLRDAFDPKLKD